MMGSRSKMGRKKNKTWSSEGIFNGRRFDCEITSYDEKRRNEGNQCGRQVKGFGVEIVD